MAMLDRYRRKGGFVQLLMLLETCDPAKQDKFLDIIRMEDSRWADAISSRMLDIPRVYSWNDETLREIVGILHDITLATALHGANEETRIRLLEFLSHGRRRKIEDLYESSRPTSAEIASTHVKILETVRKMASDGHLRFEKLDPSLVIEDEIEEKLAKSAALFDGLSLDEAHGPAALAQQEAVSISHAATPASPHPAANSEHGESRLMELQALKKRVADLSKENAMLRHELSMLKSKLDQIRKIA